jgi:predicted aspartyl protease
MDEFTPGRGPIVVEVELSGPAGSAGIRLILDTGATATLIKPGVLIALGYDPDFMSERVSIATVDGACMAPRLQLNRLSALGQHRIGFPVVCHSLPTADGVHGLLGLDFFRGTVLKIDFGQGHIELS